MAETLSDRVRQYQLLELPGQRSPASRLPSYVAAQDDSMCAREQGETMRSIEQGNFKRTRRNLGKLIRPWESGLH